MLELVDGGHALAAALEGELSHARHLALEALEGKAGLLRADEQTGFGRVAEDGVAAALLVRLYETCVGAKGTTGDEQAKLLVVGRLPLVLAAEDLALGGIANAGDLVLAVAGPQVVDGHLVLGEGAGLIGADDARGAKCLDGAQLLHEGIALAHALDGHGEGQRDRGEQSLRDERHDHAKGEDERRS